MLESKKYNYEIKEFYKIGQYAGQFLSTFFTAINNKIAKKNYPRILFFTFFVFSINRERIQNKFLHITVRDIERFKCAICFAFIRSFFLCF